MTTDALEKPRANAIETISDLQAFIEDKNARLDEAERIRLQAIADQALADKRNAEPMAAWPFPRTVTPVDDVVLALMDSNEPESTVETVTIPKSKYEQLLHDFNWLQCLEAAGVDSWSGIDQARATMSAVQAIAIELFHQFEKSMSLPQPTPPCRRQSERRADQKPVLTAEQLPQAADADGNGMVLAYHHGWTTEPWKYVAAHPREVLHWMSIKNLPEPESE